MKHIKFYFFAAMTFLAVCTIPTLSSCSEDALDGQEQPLTKADILRAKAKEFAKKYNVDMVLNEENIDSLAEVLTVEQMERDFKRIATLQITCSTKVITKPKMPAKRLKIRKVKTTEEEREQIYTGCEKIDVSFLVHYESKDENGNYTYFNESVNGCAEVRWQYGLKAAGFVHMGFSSDDNRISGGGSLSPIFSNSNGSLSFTANGPVTLRIGSKYSCVKHFSVSYSNDKLTVS